MKFNFLIHILCFIIHTVLAKDDLLSDTSDSKGNKMGQQATNIAQKAAQEAKAAEDAMQQAGQQAARQVKTQLAEKAVQAAKAAAAALSGTYKKKRNNCPCQQKDISFEKANVPINYQFQPCPCSKVEIATSSPKPINLILKLNIEPTPNCKNGSDYSPCQHNNQSNQVHQPLCPCQQIPDSRTTQQPLLCPCQHNSQSPSSAEPSANIPCPCQTTPPPCPCDTQNPCDQNSYLNIQTSPPPCSSNPPHNTENPCPCQVKAAEKPTDSPSCCCNCDAKIAAALCKRSKRAEVGK